MAISATAEIALSPKVSEKYVIHLDTILQDHHRLFKELFPDKTFKPKQHYLLHYPDLILEYGPLVRCWCLRFEGKHIFKQLVHVVRNFKDLALTLATRHQLFQICHCASRSKFFKTELDIPSSVSVPFDSLNKRYQDVLRDTGCVFQDQVIHTDKVLINGTENAVGMYVVLGLFEYGALFGKVQMILPKGCDISFLIDVYQATETYDIRAYKIHKNARGTSHPLSAYEIDKCKYMDIPA